jgi:L-asparaginase
MPLRSLPLPLISCCQKTCLLWSLGQQSHSAQKDLMELVCHFSLFFLYFIILFFIFIILILNNHKNTLANFNDSLRVLESPQTVPWSLGVVAVMNNCVHASRYLRKHDSANLGMMFQSHPGPIGELRCGEAQLYYLGLPKIKRHEEYELKGKAAEIIKLTCERTTEPLDHDDRERMEQKEELALIPQVLIWSMAVQAIAPPESLLNNIDGLVLSGMGTGSISESFVEQLSPRFTSKIPVVIVSRTAVGMNFDDFLYKGSLQKYESLGFRLREGYSHLNSLQARILLLLRLLDFAV